MIFDICGIGIVLEQILVYIIGIFCYSLVRTWSVFRVLVFRSQMVGHLAREARWFEKGRKEAIFVQMENPSLNRGGLRYHLPAIYNSVLKPKSKQFYSRRTLAPELAPGSQELNLPSGLTRLF